MQAGDRITVTAGVHIGRSGTLDRVAFSAAGRVGRWWWAHLDGDEPTRYRMIWEGDMRAAGEGENGAKGEEVRT